MTHLTHCPPEGKTFVATKSEDDTRRGRQEGNCCAYIHDNDNTDHGRCARERACGVVKYLHEREAQEATRTCEHAFNVYRDEQHNDNRSKA